MQVQQFWTFHQLLRQYNEALDLTRLHAFESIVIKHYVDCALVATLVDLPSPLLDLGSGAGFPGIPLKIVRPDVRLVLAEPRAKRVAFLEQVVRELGLRDVEIVPHRISAGFERPVRGVITRAVEAIPATLARVAPWLPTGARVLFMKGPGAESEVREARDGWGETFHLARDVSYSIPQTSHERRLVVFERTGAALPHSISAPAARLAAEPELDEWAGDEAEEDEAAATLEPAASHDDLETTRAIEAYAAPDAPRPDVVREVREIASATNPTYRVLRAVLGGRGLRKHRQALLSGIRPILEVLRDQPERARAWVTSGAAPAPPGNAPQGLVWLRVAPALFRELDVAGTGSPLLLVEARALEAWTDTDWPDGCTLFVPFQDPENVGAVLRTAAAFGVAQVVLLQEAANPYHPKSVRAAGSALLRLRLRRGPAIRALAPRGAPVLALSPGARDAGEIDFPDRFGLLVGLEGPGVPEAWRGAASIGIPMQAGTDSLNAVTATAIVLYLWRRKRG